MRDHEPVTLADLKSAYLIAFAILGYSWIATRRLDAVRTAFETQVLPESSVAFATCGLVGAERERTVFEICDPFSAVFVVGADAAVVVAFATHSTAGDLADVLHAGQGAAVGGRWYSWPLMVRETQRSLHLPNLLKPEDAWDDGWTFHLDRCAQMHHSTVTGLREPTRSINRKLRVQA